MKDICSEMMDQHYEDMTKEILDGAEDLPKVLPNTYWQHHNGCIYKVLTLANTEGDDPTKREKYPPTVVYQGVSNGKTWARRLDRWHGSMTLYNKETQ